MKQLVFFLFLSAGVLTVTSHAQQFDAALGFGGLSAPSASEATGDHQPQSISGGVFPSVSANLLLWGRFGIGGQVAWRIGQNLYQAGPQGPPPGPFRPIVFHVDGVWVPEFGETVAADFMAGFGVQSTRFYQGFFTCGAFSGCTNYQSSNHLLGHLGAGFRYYVSGNFFVRPEAHFYFVRNNIEFSGSRYNRYAVSLGYSFRPGF